MESISNKKGSAMLWTILLTVIVTILLGAVMTSAYAYFDYTMYSVKRQQAYFTAKSATNIIVDQFANVEGDDGSPVLLPKFGERIKISNLFDESLGIGKASAVIRHAGTNENEEIIEVSVTAKYADEKYVLKTDIVNQPLYFAGVAVKNLNLSGHTLDLGDGTDFYYNNEEEVWRPDGKLNIAGNLVTLHDVVIPAGSRIAGQNFDKDTTYSKNDRKRSIWSSTQYVLSNTRIDVVDYAVENKHVPDAFKTQRLYCNNTTGRKNENFGPLDVNDKINNSIADSLIAINFPGAQQIKNGITDSRNEKLSLQDNSNSALPIKYLKLYSFSNSIRRQIQEKIDSGEMNRYQQKLIEIIRQTLPLDKMNMDVYDASFIECVANNSNNRNDNVIPIVYIDVDRGYASDQSNVNSARGINLRIRFGKDPGKTSIFTEIPEKIEDMATGFIDSIFKRNNNVSYVIVNLGDNATIELGCRVGVRDGDSHDSNAGHFRDKKNLIFAYSIYGGKNSKVILNKDVTVVGEIYCGELMLNGDAKVIYANESGSQISKQKIEEIWAPIGYNKGDENREKNIA